MTTHFLLTLKLSFPEFKTDAAKGVMVDCQSFRYFSPAQYMLPSMEFLDAMRARLPLSPSNHRVEIVRQVGDDEWENVPAADLLLDLHEPLFTKSGKPMAKLRHMDIGKDYGSNHLFVSDNFRRLAASQYPNFTFSPKGILGGMTYYRLGGYGLISDEFEFRDVMDEIYHFPEAKIIGPLRALPDIVKYGIVDVPSRSGYVISGHLLALLKQHCKGIQSQLAIINFE